MRVFRDKTGLAVTPELWGSIQKALEDADYFILLASPRAAQSTWVEREVDWWLRNRSPTHLLIVWTDGELTWDTAVGDFDWVNTTALPRRLEKVFQEEPNYLDLRFAKTSTDLSLRQPKFLEAIAGLSATLQGRSLDELIGEDLGQHRKTMRWLRFAVAGLVMLTIAAGFSAFVARQAWFMAGKMTGDIEDAANQQQREAMSREVANRSLAVLETNRELAILLAAEAASVYPTAEAESALRQSLFEALPPRWTLPGHAGGTYVAQFTGDGQRVITGGADNVARVWESDRGTMVLELRGHTDGVTGIDVTPDGTRICTSSRYDQTARVWDAANGKSLFEIKQEGLAVAQFSPDEKQILTVADQGDAVLWDAISGQRLHPLPAPMRSFGELACSSVPASVQTATAWPWWTGTRLCAMSPPEKLFLTWMGIRSKFATSATVRMASGSSPPAKITPPASGVQPPVKVWLCCRTKQKSLWRCSVPAANGSSPAPRTGWCVSGTRPAGRKSPRSMSGQRNWLVSH